MLRREGHQVLQAADGAAALCRFQAERLDLVLLDLQLPRVSGFDVCRDMRAVARTPILCVSALADEASRRAALAAGADDYLRKPFSITDLLERVRALLDAAGA